MRTALLSSVPAAFALLFSGLAYAAPDPAAPARSDSPATPKHAEAKTFDLGGGAKLEMVFLKGGTFQMGSPESEVGREPTEGPMREVQLDPFFLGKHPVTVGQFRSFVEATKYVTAAEKAGQAYGPGGNSGSWGWVKGASWKNPGIEQTDDYPVVDVDWADANAFCKWLSGQTRQSFRLPTEAEWEYACRAGTRTAYQWGDNPNDGKGWMNGSDLTLERKHADRKGGFEFEDGYVYTSPVGVFKPNAWGLYDMHGNVWEWCSDWHAEDYYAKSPKLNPQGPESGTERVLRGGSWRIKPVQGRCASRYKTDPLRIGYTIGFRVAADVSSK